MSSSKDSHCRICGNSIVPVMELRDMPLFVQTLLRADQLDRDKAQQIHVCTCTVCGLVQLLEDPDQSSVYSADYIYSVAFSPHAQAYQRSLGQQWVHEHDLNGSSLLEVGGGDGFFGMILQEQGCHVTLVEPSSRACTIARERGLTRVVEGYLERDTFSDTRFDAVILRHVLEHIPQPIAFLELMRAQLHDNGKLFIEVPNLDNIVSNNRCQDFYTEHLSYFQPHSLADAVRRAGFRVLQIYAIERGDYLVCVAQISTSDIDSMAVNLGEFRSQVRQMVSTAVETGRRVGIYGAGGRGAALLALVGAHDLGLTYVVDSDAKKWGRFMPVSHLSVVSPEHLKSDPVDDLLISAVSFQDEIVDQLAWFRQVGRRLGVLHPTPHWLDGE